MRLAWHLALTDGCRVRLYALGGDRVAWDAEVGRVVLEEYGVRFVTDDGAVYPFDSLSHPDQQIVAVELVDL